MILITDDDLAIRTSLSLLLKQEGFKVWTAADPAEAYALVKEKPVGLVLLDMNFSMETSGEEGLQTLKAIRQLKPGLPVILMTGWGSISLAVEGMKNGAVDFINKPWDNMHVIQSVKTALRLSDRSLSQTDNSLTRKELDKKYGFENIIGEDPALLS